MHALTKIRTLDPAVLVFSAILFAVFSGGFVAALNMGFAQRLLPLTVCSLGLILCLALGLKFLTAPEPSATQAEDDVLSTFDGASEASDTATLRYTVWMFSYLVALWGLGLWVSTIVFTAAFLWIERRSSVLSIATVSAITLLTAYSLGRMLNVTWPTGFLPF